MSVLSRADQAQSPASSRHPALDLLTRYGDSFRSAWRARHDVAGPRRLADEQAFLPAAMSLQETPPHPAPQRTALVICALFGVAMAWACFGELDVVAVAPGRIIVSERSKTIQPLEASVVRAIHVRDGDVVHAGQLLVELDPTVSQADGSRVTEERRAAFAEWVRAQALLASLDSAKNTDRSLKAAVTMPEGQTFEGWREEDAAAAMARTRAEWQEHRAKLAQLAAESGRRVAELDTTREVIAKLKATLPLARQREADYRGLTDQGFMSGHAGQDRMRERIELERDLATARARFAEVQASLAESQRTQAAHVAETRRAWHDRVAQARLKLAELAQEHTKADRRQTQTRLTAPVAGTVQQLAIHTPGGVVTPAQALMVIVPGADGDELIAEVSIENKDIGFVHAGQAAEVKFETFTFTRYGTVPAKVQWVTADAVVNTTSTGNKDSDNKAGSAATQAIFPARLLLARTHISVDGRVIRLSPGLNLTAEVKTGQRRVIDYLLSPVRQSLSESMRER